MIGGWGREGTLKKLSKDFQRGLEKDVHKDLSKAAQKDF